MIRASKDIVPYEKFRILLVRVITNYENRKYLAMAYEVGQLSL